MKWREVNEKKVAWFGWFWAALLHVLFILFFLFNWRPALEPLPSRLPAPTVIEATLVSQVPFVKNVPAQPLIPPQPRANKPFKQAVTVIKKSSLVMMPQKKLMKPSVMKSSITQQVAVATPIKLIKPAPTTKKPSVQKVIHAQKKKAPYAAVASLQTAQKTVEKYLQQEVDRLLQTKPVAWKNKAITEKYQRLILSAIAQQWIIPPDLDKQLETKLIIRLGKNGTVLAVIIAKSSGSSVLDTSAQTAVYKASPLPIPKDRRLYSDFKQINLTMRPEDVFSNN